MNIPLFFYIKYWIKNSAFALGTGFLLTFLILPRFALAPYLPFIFCLMYQFVIFRNFFGKREGDFEYHYKEYQITKKSNQFVKFYLGWPVFITYLLDKTNNIISTAWDIHEKLTAIDEIKASSETQFYINMIGANLSRKEDDINKEKDFLHKAIQIKPNDLVANYRLAVVLERAGLGEDSKDRYQAAFNDPTLSSARLREFIYSQITRVKEYGPKKSPPMPGFKYMTW